MERSYEKASIARDSSAFRVWTGTLEIECLYKERCFNINVTDKRQRYIPSLIAKRVIVQPLVRKHEAKNDETKRCIVLIRLTFMWQMKITKESRLERRSFC